MLAERSACLNRDIYTRAAWHVVDDHGAGNGVSCCRIMRDQSCLRALVVIGRYKKNRVHAHRCSDTAQLQCMSRVVCTCSGDDSASSSTIFDCMRNQCKLFVVCHGRCLAGRSADNNCVNACCKLEIQQLVHDGKIDRTLLERRDERSRNALKYGLFQRIAPFGIISL